MKLLIEQDDGSIVELKELVGVDDAANVLIALSKHHLQSDYRMRIEEEMTRITGKRWVILPPCIEKVVGIKSRAKEHN